MSTEYVAWTAFSLFLLMGPLVRWQDLNDIIARGYSLFQVIAILLSISTEEIF